MLSITTREKKENERRTPDFFREKVHFSMGRVRVEVRVT